MKLPRRIKMFRVSGSDVDELDRMLRVHAAQERDQGKKAGDRYLVPEEIVKAVIGIATNTWKARRRLIDPVSGEVGEEMKRLNADIERIQRCLEELGVVIEDHTNQPFDYGLPWKVVATKPTTGIQKEMVTETLRPTIRWHDQIIQHAEVEIATPVSKQESRD
jgi:hypothetical protein